jgi:asparagine synthase (glutamine-hydrolysing)
MCGIAGVVRFHAPVSEEHVAPLLAELAHRGPDGTGAYRVPGGRACLAHRRLAIIDPGEGGRQPMGTADGRHHLVFNGEIYNHRELRAGMPGPWRSASDAEVLLRLLVRDGPEGLVRVRGMFAFALWDEAEQQLLLARDRFGIKPLYWTASPGQVAFASEVGALVRTGLAVRRASPAGVLAYLRWASVPPPLTWVEGVSALRPGTWRRWDSDGQTREGRFADVRRAWVTALDHPRSDPVTVQHTVEDALVDAVRAHLVADVPVGVFLSGGLDSAAIVKACHTLGTGTVRTFTVVTDGNEADTSGAAIVARRFGTEHHELHVDRSRFAAEYVRFMRHLDQPSADGANTYLVAGALASTGMKCVLSGIGGDELLGGYPSFARIPRAIGPARAARLLAVPAGAALSRLVPAPTAARWRHAAGSGGAIPELYRAARGFLMPDELERLSGPALRDSSGAIEAVNACERELFEAAGDERAAASVARLETCGYLRQQLLRDADVMAMAHGVEVRTPFVDHELLARTWPVLGACPRLLRRKAILRRWLAADLPRALTSQPKRGFVLPFDQWIDGPLADTVRAGLADLSRLGWLAPEAADTIWGAWRRRELHWSRPWGLAVLGRFLSDG